MVWIRYDCQPSGVLAAKLNAYGLETSPVRHQKNRLHN